MRAMGQKSDPHLITPHASLSTPSTLPTLLSKVPHLLSLPPTLKILVSVERYLCIYGE